MQEGQSDLVGYRMSACRKCGHKIYLIGAGKSLPPDPVEDVQQ